MRKHTDILSSVRCWCKHHGDLKGSAVCAGEAREVQKRVYGLREPPVRRIVWQCCHPAPHQRATRLDSDLEQWRLDNQQSRAKQTKVAKPDEPLSEA